MLAALVGWMALSSQAPAQTIRTLVDYTSSWRYNQSGTDLGTAWRDFTYASESTWPLGQGLLGLETTPAVYPVPFNTPLTVPTPLAFYFRIHFTWNANDPTNGTTLVASNLVDDGHVMFLNGVEVNRLRVAAGQNYMSQATGTGTEGLIEVATLPAGLLRNGDNVLAVEVHQSGTASSDVAWGTKLVAIIPTAVAIVTQPMSQTVALGSPASFSVGISGGPGRYQWQKSASGANSFANISATATNTTYAINNVVANDAGDYRVIVTSAVNSVTSAPAALTVVSDSTGPQIIQAVVREVVQTVGTTVVTNFNQIDITFDEQLNQASATSVSNFQVVRWEGRAVIPLVSAQYSFPVVRLTVNTNAPSSWFYRSNYFVCVTNVPDVRGNLIDPDSCVGVSWRITTNVMQMNAAWKFFDSAIFSHAPYNNQQWKNTNYVPGPDWGDGIGIFAFGIDVGTSCAGDTQGSFPSYQQEPTLYRGNFNLTTNASRTGTLNLRHFIDDGAVFYLNGTEIYRYNVANPGSVVATNTRAAANITVSCQTNVTVNVTNLNPGQNLLAVAQCDGPAIDSETAFGVEVDNAFLLTGPAPPPRPVLPAPRFTSVTRSGNNITLTWTNTAAILLTSTNVAPSPTWTPVAGATTPYTTPATGPTRFYRLRNP